MHRDIWIRLSTRSRRALLKTKRRGGRPYYYNPRWTLIQRLSRETGKPEMQVYNELLALRKDMLSHIT